MTAAVPLAPSSCHSVTSHIPASTDTQRPLILLAPTPSSSAPIPGFQLLSFAAQDLKPSDYRAGAFTAFILTLCLRLCRPYLLQVVLSPAAFQELTTELSSGGAFSLPTLRVHLSSPHCKLWPNPDKLLASI